MYIETLVVFDIETTGLPQMEKNRTKITELSFLAVSRRDIERTALEEIPLLNKLSLLFDPQKNIQAIASEITGLTNTTLKNQLTFKNRIPCINSFLEGLPKPLCLIAHNGNCFDFKILRAEYSDANEVIPANIHCIDSLSIFRKILKGTNLCFDDLKKKSSKVYKDELITNDEDWPELNTTPEDWEEIDKLCDSFTSNLISPKASPVKSLDESLKCETVKDEVRKPTKIAVKSTIKPKKISHKVSDLYKRLLNKNVVEVHRAEADCLMLLQCVVALKKEFLPLVDSQCKLLEEIEPLQRR